jgi:hypothetical protein
MRDKSEEEEVAFIRETHISKWKRGEECGGMGEKLVGWREGGDGVGCKGSREYLYHISHCLLRRL